MADWRAVHIAGLYDKCDAATARAEAAEAEVVRLRALADDPATNPYWRLRADRADATIQRVRELHVRKLDYKGRPYCEECQSLCHSRSGLGCDDVDGAWPCATIAALDDVAPHPWQADPSGFAGSCGFPGCGRIASAAIHAG